MEATRLLKMNGENSFVTNIFIIAASHVLRVGLEAILRDDERLFAAGGAADISAAPFDLQPGQNIDVLLVSVERMAEFNNLLEFLSDEAAEDTNSPLFVVALLAPELQSAERAIELLQNGARGILPNNAGASEIRGAISAAANDLTVAAPEILNRMFAARKDEKFPLDEKAKAGDEEFYENLTPREMEVLELLAEGESNKAIAYQLNISEHTVKFHVASVFAKFGVNSRTEAVTQAIRRGLILL